MDDLPTPTPRHTAEPAGEFLDRLARRLSEPGPDVATTFAQARLVIAELLGSKPAQFANPRDCSDALSLLMFLTRREGDALTAWKWATTVSAPHMNDVAVLTQLAGLGDQLRNKPGVTESLPIDPATLRQWFERAMQLAPDEPAAFARAGIFFLNKNDDGEAERCFARAFELDAASEFVAIQLADLMTRRQQPAEALAVLEKSLSQHPEPSPDLLWKAGLAAVAAAQPQAVLRHLDALAPLDPERRWVAYYQAIAHLDLGEFPKAAQAIQREADLVKMPSALHIHTVRAAVAAGLGNSSALQAHLQAIATSHLGLVNYLSQSGVAACFTRAWRAAKIVSRQSPVWESLQSKMLKSGLTPTDFWTQARENLPRTKGLKHFWVDMRQPLDHRWASAGMALPGQESWTACRIRYGVLAFDESEARKVALHWQTQSFDLPPVITATTLDSTGFTDTPGVTRRSWPEAEHAA